MTLGEIIRQYCTEHSLSQRQFAKLCGLSHGYISILVNGRNPTTGAPAELTVGSLDRIAGAMGKTIDQVIAEADDMPIRLSEEIVPPSKAEDEELWALREALRRDPDLLLLFDAAKNATAEDLREAADLIRARKTIRDITNRR